MKPARQKPPEPALPVLPLLPSPPGIDEFREIVLGYYRESGRDLAWRKTTDPYRILVSEIMLQQTQVDRVTERYPAFIGKFPDFPALAASPLADVLGTWQGMGYNRRAIALQKCARLVVDEYGGVLPQDPEILRTFPGIGPATAASICAFAFNMPVVFIETNIRRVFIHFFFRGETRVDDSAILPLARQALPAGDARTWYNALMDLGTELRKTGTNPNRRSVQYTKQPAFAGSDRMIRGRILRLLLQGGHLSPDAIAENLAEDPARVLRIVQDLEKEGFVAEDGTSYCIART